MENLDETKKEQNNRPIHRFQKGQSGNPKGRPKDSISVITVVKRILKERAKTTDGKKKEKLEILARNIVEMAIENREKDMIKMIVNYVDGMPKGTIDLGATEELKEFILKLNNLLDDQT